MIDVHCHVLPGIDDGPGTVPGSLALARAAVAAGTTTLVATPHVSSRYPTDAETIAAGVRDLRDRLAEAGVTLELLGGAEIALARLADIPANELARLSLAGNGWLLVEPPFTAAASGLDTVLLAVIRRGHRLVLAHPERCESFRRYPEMLGRLIDHGVITSITAGSLVGQFGAEVQRFTFELVRRGMVHNVASDAHDHLRRGPGIADALERAGLLDSYEWWTELVPAALLRGESPPPRSPPVS